MTRNTPEIWTSEYFSSNRKTATSRIHIVVNVSMYMEFIIGVLKFLSNSNMNIDDNTATDEMKIIDKSWVVDKFR